MEEKRRSIHCATSCKTLVLHGLETQALVLTQDEMRVRYKFVKSTFLLTTTTCMTCNPRGDSRMLLCCRLSPCGGDIDPSCPTRRRWTFWTVGRYQSHVHARRRELLALLYHSPTPPASACVYVSMDACSKAILFLERTWPSRFAPPQRDSQSTERITMKGRRKEWLLESCFRLQNNVRE